MPVTTSFIFHFIFLDEVATATIAADFPQLGQSQPHLMATSHMLCHMSRVTCHTSHPSHDHQVTILWINQVTINKHC